MPDPTELTDRAIARLEKALLSHIDSELAIRDERLKGIDEATRLQLAQFEQIPAQTDEKIAARAALVDVMFGAVQVQFKDRDTLSQRESALNKVALDAAFNASKEAVAAALTAQKEAAAKQDEANAKAIDKSERATAETISTNLALTRSTTDGLTKGQDELKLSVAGLVAGRAGAKEDRTALYQVLAAAAIIIGAIIAIAGFVVRL